MLTNPGNNGSPLVRSRREVVGSAGIVQRRFVDVNDGSAFDTGGPGGANGPAIGGLSTRQVTNRNTPSVINAVFNVHFRDGRASNVFSGGTPFGESDTRGFVLVARAGALDAEPVRLDNASLASQAVAGSPANASLSGARSLEVRVVTDVRHRLERRFEGRPASVRDQGHVDLSECYQ